MQFPEHNTYFTTQPFFLSHPITIRKKRGMAVDSSRLAHLYRAKHGANYDRWSIDGE